MIYAVSSDEAHKYIVTFFMFLRIYNILDTSNLKNDKSEIQFEESGNDGGLLRNNNNVFGLRRGRQR